MTARMPDLHERDVEQPWTWAVVALGLAVLVLAGLAAAVLP